MNYPNGRDGNALPGHYQMPQQQQQQQGHLMSPQLYVQQQQPQYAQQRPQTYPSPQTYGGVDSGYYGANMQSNQQMNTYGPPTQQYPGFGNPTVGYNAGMASMAGQGTFQSYGMGGQQQQQQQQQETQQTQQTQQRQTIPQFDWEPQQQQQHNQQQHQQQQQQQIFHGLQQNQQQHQQVPQHQHQTQFQQHHIPQITTAASGNFSPNTFRPQPSPVVHARQQLPQQPSPSPTQQVLQLHSFQQPQRAVSVHSSSSSAHNSPYQNPQVQVQARVQVARSAAPPSRSPSVSTYNSPPAPPPRQRSSQSGVSSRPPSQNSPLVQSSTLGDVNNVNPQQINRPKPNQPKQSQPKQSQPKQSQPKQNQPKPTQLQPTQVPQNQSPYSGITIPSPQTVHQQLAPPQPEQPMTINPADIFSPQIARPRPPSMTYSMPVPTETKKEEEPPAKKQQLSQPPVQPAEIPSVVVPGMYLQHAPQQSFSSHSKNRTTLSALLDKEEEKPQVQAEPKPKAPPHDDHVRYDAVLIGLADEYFEAAYRLGPKVARLGGEAQGSEENIIDTYQKLIVAGLTCFESALKNFKYVPAVEAALIQKYAAVMFEETENYDDMEAILTRGIALCDRNKLFDQKYCMHHLLARVTNCRRPNAAFKALDKVIKEVEQKNNAPWEYALRFLHITLSLERATHHDVVVALQHLRAISDLAEKHADKAVFVYCAAIEALCYIYTESSDCITSAQDSIARARSLQMDRWTQDIQTVWYFLNCVDLVCSLLKYEKAEVMTQKMDAIQSIVEKGAFSKDGALSIPLGTKSSKLIQDFGGKVFAKIDTEMVTMQFHWLPGIDIFSLACLLSTCTGILKSAADIKNTKFIHQGLKNFKNYLDKDPDKNSDSEPLEIQSRSTISKRLEKSYEIRWYMNLYQTILLCIHSKWNLARRTLEELEADITNNASPQSEVTERWTTYVRAMIEQGTGNLDTAAALYRSPILLAPSFSGQSSSRLLGTTAYDISVLARLNLLFLLRDPTMPSLEASNLLSDLESRLLPAEHPSAALHVALDLNRALNTPSSAILAKKKPLQLALVRSSRGNPTNDQLACLAMGAMVHLFFADMLSGDGQAAKSRETLLKLSVRLGSPLWQALAQGLMLQGEVLATKEEKEGAWNQVQKAIGDMKVEGVKGEFV